MAFTLDIDGTPAYYSNGGEWRCRNEAMRGLLEELYTLDYSGDYVPDKEAALIAIVERTFPNVRVMQRDAPEPDVPGRIY